MNTQTIRALLIIDLDGKRIYSKYYEKNPSLSLQKQQDIENRVAKSVASKGNNDLFLLDKYVVIYRQLSDTIVAMLTDPSENEIFVNMTLNCIVDGFDKIFERGFDKKIALEYYDKIAIAIDEVIDDGIVLETDSQALADRVNFKNLEGTESAGFSEISLSSALNFAKGSLLSFWKGGK